MTYKNDVVGFFDDLPPPEADPEPAMHGAPWGGPPIGVIGGWVPWRIVLVRTEHAYALLRDFEAFPTGLSFQLVACFDENVFGPERREPEDPPVTDTRPWIGVRFSDGREAATQRVRGMPTSGGNERRPVSRGRGGTGHPGEWRLGYWLWPLPPPGPLTWFATWPEVGVGEASVEVDASALGPAAVESEQLWEDADQRF